MSFISIIIRKIYLTYSEQLFPIATKRRNIAVIISIS